MNRRDLVKREDVPQAWKAWRDYEVMRREEMRRLVFWPDNLPLFPYGQCPANLSQPTYNPLRATKIAHQ